MRLKPSAMILTSAVLVLAAMSSHASTFSPERDTCPSYAFEVEPPSVYWHKIVSDAHALACMRAVAEALGPEATRHWLEREGFNATFIKQFSSKSRLLSAGWPIHIKGLLYTPGMLRGASLRVLAYSQVFAFSWEESGQLRVSQSYTFK